MTAKDVLKKIIEDSDFDIAPHQGTEILYNEIIANGYSKERISKKIELKTGYPYKSIENKEPNMEIVNELGLDFLIKNRVFPFTDNGYLYMAINDTETINMLSQIPDFLPCFEYGFVIKAALEKLKAQLDDDTSQDIIEVTNEKTTITLASRQDFIENVIISKPMFRERFEVIDTLTRREDLIDHCMSKRPEILLVSDALIGSENMMFTLISLHSKFPEMRIVYLVGDVDITDNARVNDISILAGVGIYDIIEGKTFTIKSLFSVLMTPKTQKDIKERIKTAEQLHKAESKIEIKVVDEELKVDSTICKNIYTFISPKGSVGTTTIAGNVAIALSKFATNPKPTVAVVDLDMQFSQLSNQLGTTDKNNNIYTALAAAKKITEAINVRRQRGEDNTQTDEDICNMELIDRCMVQNKQFKNLYVLGGSGTVYETGHNALLESTPLTYIIERLAKKYDIVIIDANTDIECLQSFCLYAKSHYVYNVFDYSVQSINANCRYFSFIKEVGIYNKVNNKVIINNFFITENPTEEQKHFNSLLNVPGNIYISSIPKPDAYRLDGQFNFAISRNDEVLAPFNQKILEIANDMAFIPGYDEMKKRLDIVTKVDTKPKKGFLSFFKE